MGLAKAGVVIDNSVSLAIAGMKPVGLAAQGNVIWSAATPTVATTLDPTKTMYATLSNGNLTITSIGIGGISLSTSSRSGGKYHLEVMFNSAFIADGSAVGLATPNFHLINWLGASLDGIGIWSGGRSGTNVYIDGGAFPILSPGWTTGDFVAFEVDLDARLMWILNYTAPFPWNGSSTANPATGVGGASLSGLSAGPYFFCAGPYNTAAFTVNFGATPFSVPPSSGFVPWG